MAENAKNQELITEMRRRYELAKAYWSPVFERARDDIRFIVVPGSQWDENLKKRRQHRPTYEFPVLRGQVQQIINEQKQSRPQAKVRGQGEDDKALAEIMQGLYRNIESVSNAEKARDIAYESAVRGGVGFYRVTTDYARPDDFDLDIVIRPVRNFSGAYCDPSAVELDRRDSTYWFVPESCSKAEFERRFPKADMTGFYANGACASWREADKVTFAEYWYKVPKDRVLLRLSSGETVFEDELQVDEAALAEQGITIERRRTVESHKVMTCLTNGHELLTDPVEFPCRWIPIIPVFGNIDCIDGEDYISGAVRFGKDAQRLRNVHRTAMVEAIAKAPKAPFIVRAKDIKGYEHFWNSANSEDYAYLPVADEAVSLPQRTAQAEVPVALIQSANLDSEDMKAATGIYDASLGARSNETSGKAIAQRKMQGATSSYNYLDNLVHAIQFEAEIIGDMLPKVIDTPRVVRTLGQDGGEKWVQLYRQVQDPETGEMRTINDIGKGKYDYTVTIGPSYATQRMEAAEMYANLIGQIGPAMPQIGMVLAYQVLKHSDLPGGDEADEVIRKILVSQKIMEPKEGDSAPEPPQPNPKDVATAKKDDAQARKAGAEADAQELENAVAAVQIGVDAAMSGMPLPMQPQPQAPGAMPVDMTGAA